MKEIDLPVCRCPDCGYAFDKAVKIMGSAPQSVRPGPDRKCITLCLRCGVTLEFKGEGAALTVEKYTDHASLPEPVREMLANVKMAMMCARQKAELQ